MLSGWKKMLQGMSESMSNLASNAVADAAISASLTLPTLHSANEADAWRALGAHNRSCLHTISENQNNNHASTSQTCDMLLSVCSKMQGRDALVGRLPQDIEVIAESKSAVALLAAELAIMSEELISLTDFLAVFREAHISRTVAKMKKDAAADVERAQKNSHARVTAAARARDLRLDTSVNVASAPVSIPTATSLPSAASYATAANAAGFTQAVPTSRFDHSSSAAEVAPEAVSIPPECIESAGENVVIDFEVMLASEQDGALPNSSAEGAGCGTTSE
jgi:hypothetical protein